MFSKRKTVFVGMSGGVDSSVAAMLLKKQGYDVVGVFMRCYNVDGCAERDAEDARRVASHLGIPFYVWDFEKEYKERVVHYMIEGYRAGITPNPDVACNREIKFGLFLWKALTMGADYVATGHYVRMRAAKMKSKKIYKLFAAADKNKDQSYFLWTLTQQELSHALFPIGAYTKPRVRAIARSAGLPTAEKKDSQGICFLGKVSIADFLKQYIPERRGALLTTAGEKIGEHSGAEFYTIGQRHINAEFFFPKTGGAAPREPFYVAAKDAMANTVILAAGKNNDALSRSEVKLGQLNIVDPIGFGTQKAVDVYARLRYRQPLSPARLEFFFESGGVRRTAELRFEKPQKFVAPGQSAVFYSKTGEMLGGGIIL